MMIVAGFVAALTAVFVFGGSAAGAASVPDGFTASPVAEVGDPTAMAVAADGRIFVAQKGGGLRIIENGTLKKRPFAEFRVNSLGERGLLGVALHPNFAANKFVYVYRTVAKPKVHNEVVRVRADGDRMVPGSQKVILRLNSLDAERHNGGAIHFGTGGKLYVAVGDNGREGSPQRLKNLFGKMLRINADGSIPRSNPFYKQASGKNRAIWALGLRNPYSFAVRPGTGAVYINDVGEMTWEEINAGKAGANYGWPIKEGPESANRFRAPIHAYRHDGTSGGCAITGGTFYDPQAPQFPSSYEGDYFFTDFCGGYIRRYDPETDSVSGFATGLSQPVDLQVSPDGSLYTLERGTGSVNEIQYTGG
ncbi:MAG: PQQ-dependent sugar dehydrogenase [Actinomycetota bacterium]|nr:PQQ-dependent sugar dehydrogenase [Actinomycetota bacterium]